MNTVIECIKKRRSIRSFNQKSITKETIEQLLDSARWAPSGKNLQPWKFIVIASDSNLKENIASLSVCRQWLKTAPCFIIAYLDRQLSYDYIKDIQAIGASIQNILLSADELGLSSCWVGEILKCENGVNNLLSVPEHYQLMALIAIGYSDKAGTKSNRRKTQENILAWY